MKAWLIGVLVLAVAGTSLPDLADAKRLGGGKSQGMQRNMPERTAPAQPAPPAGNPGAAGTPASPAANPAAAAGAAAPAAAAASSRSWLGPIAGLAAGLGIAALLSSMGLGGAFADFLMLALLLVAGFFLVRFILRRMNGQGGAPGRLAPQGAGAGDTSAAGRTGLRQADAPVMARTPVATPAAEPASPVAQPTVGPAGTTLPPLQPVLSPQGLTAEPVAEAAPAQPALRKAFVPATFDSEGFERVAKAIFVRLQAANDTADLDDIRRFTTPEMFAEIRLDLQDRNGAQQTTDVKRVDAKVIDVAEEDGQQVVSVRYTGEVVEESGAEPVAFDEVWHLVKPLDDSRAWAIAGIEQSR
jgi:predicted lipid-binding transport protein (Tim44 family)